MSNKAIPEIEHILSRLEEIEDERAHLHDVESSKREDLLREEHRLEARLTELRDRASRSKAGTAEERASAQTDITRTPKLPDSRRNR